MNYSLIFLVLLIMTVVGYYIGRNRARTVSGSVANAPSLHSLPGYHGANVAIWMAVPALLIMLFWVGFQGTIIEGLVFSGLPETVSIAGNTKQKSALSEAEKQLLINNIRNFVAGDIVSGTITDAIKRGGTHYRSLQSTSSLIMAGVLLLAVSLALFLTYRSINPTMRARNVVERAVSVLLILASSIAILVMVGIVFSLLFEAFEFFTKVSLFDFLFGTKWSTQIAIRSDQAGASGSFGAIPVFLGTFLITLIAMVVAVPVGLFSAIYLAEYAPPRIRSSLKPIIEVLAGIPTVVYGFFAALTVAPFIRDLGQSLGLDVASESALAAGLVMGFMIIPFVSSLSDDVITAVPQSLRDGAFALGATKSETIRQVILPAALPGVVGAILLAVSRAIGETMIVVMAAGLSANLTFNPLEAVTTVTAQIVTNLTGDPEFDSPKTLSAFALGLVLFIVTLFLNVLALRVVRRYREKYD